MPEQQTYRLLPWSEAELHPENPRRGNIPRIVESIRINGFYGGCGRQASTGYFIWGNHRYLAARQALELMDRAQTGAWEATDAAEALVIASWQAWPQRHGSSLLEGIPCFDIDCDDEEALNILLWDNETSDEAEWARPELADMLTAIEERRGSLADTPFDADRLAALRTSAELDGAGAFARPLTVKLADRFLVPPFSVLDARQGYWQERKRAWLDLGIRSELGRPRNLLKMSETVLEAQRPGKKNLSVGGTAVASGSGGEGAIRMGIASNRQPNGSVPESHSGNDPQFYWKKQQAEKVAGRELSTEEFLAGWYEGPDAYVEGTSVFDPVLTELAYRWWSPEGARVLDPFAGGSVRGIVASRLGREYIGWDLRAEQIAANEEQARAIVRGDDPMPLWVHADARTIVASDLPAPVDFVFSCPPYFDLEQYGDDPADLSNTGSWGAFCDALDEIVAAACAQLRPGRFACFVVGNVRAHGGAGEVQDLTAATVHAFEAAGLLFYNDAVLVTAVGSLAIRAARIFQTRKLGRTHQMVLTFLKPPLATALEDCGPIEVVDPTLAFGEPL